MDSEQPGPSGEITLLLQRWSSGDGEAGERLMPLVYDELRRMAARYLSRWRGDQTLQRTALVHEAFLRLVDQRHVSWQSRAHFYGLAAQMMRRVAVDQARRRGRLKRGGDVPKVAPEDTDLGAQPSGVEPVDAIGLDRALTALEAFDPSAARIVELRFFGGLTVEETAEVMQVSPSSIKRDWAVAKGWLYQQMTGARET